MSDSAITDRLHSSTSEMTDPTHQQPYTSATEQWSTIGDRCIKVAQICLIPISMILIPTSDFNPLVRTIIALSTITMLTSGIFGVFAMSQATRKGNLSQTPKEDKQPPVRA